MSYNVTTNSKVIRGNPCTDCGSDLKRRDSGDYAVCNPIVQKQMGNAELVKRRRAIEAHQHRHDEYGL